MLIRLQKVIADSGLVSRRKAEEWIAQGRVTVNGRVVRELGTKVDPAKDHVKVDGRHLKEVPPQVFLMLNKPKGYMSSLSDPAGRPTITDLLTGVGLRVFPVGRLDYDSEGLMLLTNQGEIAQALLHPRYHVAKTYLIKVKGVLTDEEIGALERGVELEDGLTGPAVVKKIRKAKENSWVEITIHEGRKHQVKRMLETVGHPVIKLTRVRFGSLSLADLPRGHYRYLTDREANQLRALVRSRQEAVAASREPSRLVAPPARRPTRQSHPARPARPARSTYQARPTRSTRPASPARWAKPSRRRKA